MSITDQVIASIQAGYLEEADLYFDQALNQADTADLLDLADIFYGMGFYGYLERLVRHLLQSQSPSDELYIYMAEIYFDKGEIAEAFEWLDQIPTSSPHYMQSLLAQADLYLHQGWSEVAEMKLKEAQALDGDEGLIDLALAELYFNLQRYAEAIPIYESLWQSSSDLLTQDQLTHRLAAAYAGMGEWERAIEFYHHSIDDQEHSDKYFELGVCYIQNDENDKAVESFKQVLQLDPSFSSAYPYLAQSLIALNQTDQAKDILLQSLAYDEYSSQTYHLLALLSQDQAEEKDQVEAYFKKAMDLDPDSLQIKKDYLTYLYGLNALDAILSFCDQLTSSEREDPDILWLLAKIYHQVEHYEKAHQCFLLAKPYFNDSIDFLEDYLTFMREDGQWELVRQALDQALALDPSSPYFTQLEADLSFD